MRNTKAMPARSVRPKWVAFDSSVEIGIARMTRSVAMFVKVETVTEDILCTAEHRCLPGPTAQLDDIGLHQKAMRNMCSKNVAVVKAHARPNVTFVRFPCREKME